MGEAEEVLGRRQSEGQPARETALDSLDSKRGFCQDQYQPQAQGLLQKSLSRLVKAISRIIYWSVRQVR